MGKRGGIRRYPIQQGKIDKYRNTVSKIIEIPIPHVQLVTHTLYPSRVFFLSQACVHQQSTQLYNNREAPSLGPQLFIVDKQSNNE